MECTIRLGVRPNGIPVVLEYLLIPQKLHLIDKFLHPPMASIPCGLTRQCQKDALQTHPNFLSLSLTTWKKKIPLEICRIHLLRLSRGTCRIRKASTRPAHLVPPPSQVLSGTPQSVLWPEMLVAPFFVSPGYQVPHLVPALTELR